MVHLSPEFNPLILKGIKIYPDNPFKFDFILDKGDSSLNSSVGNAELKDETTKLIKYFLASLTTPEKDLWVNLSPYEKNRIIPQSFGLTEMGRDLLAEDYILKQITASLIYPEEETGKRFWKRIYEESYKKFGTTNIPVNTFNKVWIIPEKAVVYENAKTGTAFVVDSKLKVMLEQDYLALSKNLSLRSREGDAAMTEKSTKNDVNALGSQIVREIIIPELTKEVNDNENFAPLRQVYNSLILASWYKKKIRTSLLAQAYLDRKKIGGTEYNKSVFRIPSDNNDAELIYQRYIRAFKKGVYNYIKEEVDIGTNERIPRKYFSGGVKMVDLVQRVNAAMISGPDAGQMVSGLMSKLKLIVVNVGLSAIGLGTPVDNNIKEVVMKDDTVLDVLKRMIPNAKINDHDLQVWAKEGVVSLEDVNGKVIENPNWDLIQPGEKVCFNLDSEYAKYHFDLNEELKIIKGTLSAQDRLQAFSKILAEIVRGRMALSDPMVRNMVIDSIGEFNESKDRTLLRELILAYQELLKPYNRAFHSVLSPKLTPMEINLQEIRDELAKDPEGKYVSKVRALLSIMEEKYIAMAPLEAIGKLNLIPSTQIRLESGIDIETAKALALQIANARGEINKTSEQLSALDNDGRSRKPVTFRIVSQIDVEHPLTAVQYIAGKDEVQIGVNALESQGGIAELLQREFRKAIFYRMTGLVLKLDPEKQSELVGLMSNVPQDEKGISLSDFVLYCNLTSHLTFEKAQNFLLALSDGKLKYDELEAANDPEARYASILSYIEAEQMGEEIAEGGMDDVYETAPEPGRISIALEPVRNTLAAFGSSLQPFAKPAVAVILALIAGASAAHATGFGVHFDVADNHIGDLHQIGHDQFTPVVGVPELHAPVVMDHTLGRGDSITVADQQYFQGLIKSGYVTPEDLITLKAGVNNVTGNSYEKLDTDWIAAHWDHLFTHDTVGWAEQAIFVAVQHKQGIRENGRWQPEMEAAIAGAYVTTELPTALQGVSKPAGHFKLTNHVSHEAPVAGPASVMPGVDVKAISGTAVSSSHVPTLSEENSTTSASGAGSGGPGAGAPPPDEESVRALLSVGSNPPPVMTIPQLRTTSSSGPDLSRNLSATNTQTISQSVMVPVVSSVTPQQIQQYLLENIHPVYVGADQQALRALAESNGIANQRELNRQGGPPALLVSLNENNLFASEATFLSPVDFLTAIKHAKIDIYVPIVAITDPLQWAHLNDEHIFRRLSVIEAEEFDFDMRPFVVKFSGEINDQFKEGLLITSAEMAKETVLIAQGRLQAREDLFNIRSILGVQDGTQAREWVKQAFPDAVVPEGQDMLLAVEMDADNHPVRFYSRSQWKNVEDKTEGVLRAVNIDGQWTGLKYLPSNDFETMSFAFVNQPTNTHRVILGRNYIVRQRAEAFADLFLAEVQNKNNIQYQAYLQNEQKFNRVMTLISSGLSMGLPGLKVPVSGIVDLAWDLFNRPGIIKTPTQNELMDFVGQYLYNESGASASWTSLTDAQKEIYIKQAHQAVNGELGQEQLAQLHHYVETQYGFNHVARYLGDMLSVTNLTTVAMPHNVGSIIDNLPINPISGDVSVNNNVAWGLNHGPQDFVNYGNMVAPTAAVVVKQLLPGTDVNLYQLFNKINLEVGNGNPLRAPFPYANGPVISFNFFGLYDTKLKSEINNIRQINAANAEEIKPDGSNSAAYSFDNGWFSGKMHTYTQREVSAQQLKGFVIGMTDNRPIYAIVERNASGHITYRLLFMTKSGVLHTAQETQKEMENYDLISRLSKEGGVEEYMSAMGGTLNQRPEFGLQSFDYIHRDASSRRGYVYDEAGVLNLAVDAKDTQRITHLEKFFRSIYHAQKTGFQGYAEYYDVYNLNRAEGDGAPGIGPNGAVLLSLLNLRHELQSQGDQTYMRNDDMINSLAGWIGKNWQREAGTEPIALATGAMREYVKFMGKGTKVYQQMATSLAVRFDWQRGLFYSGDGKSHNNTSFYSADANTRTFLSMGIEQFMQTTSYNLDDVMGWAQNVETEFGVSDHFYVDGQRVDVKGLSLADAQARAHGYGNVIMYEVTGEYVQVLNEVIRYAHTQGNAKVEAKATAMRDAYLHSLQSAADANGGYLPQASRPNVPTGFGYETAEGHDALASFEQFKKAESDINDFNIGGAIGSVPDLGVFPATAVSDDMTRAKISIGDKSVDEDRRTIPDADYIQGSGNSEATIPNTTSGTSTYHHLERSDEYLKQLKLNAEIGQVNAQEMQNAQQGIPGYEAGGALVSQTGVAGKLIPDQNTGRMVRNTAWVRDVFDPAFDLLTDQEKALAELQGYASIPMTFDGQSVLVTRIFPIDKDVYQVTKDPFGKPVLDVYNNGLLKYSVDREHITVPLYDLKLRVKLRSYVYPNPFSASHDQMIQQPVDYMASVQPTVRKIDTSTGSADAQAIAFNTFNDLTRVRDPQHVTTRSLYLDRTNPLRSKAQEFTVHHNPDHESSLLYDTRNNLNPYGLPTGAQASQVFENGDQITAPLTTPQEFIDRLEHPHPGLLRFTNASPVGPSDRNLGHWGDQLPEVNHNAVTGIEHPEVIDSTGRIDNFVSSDNINGHLRSQNTTFQYDPDQFDGQVAVNARTKSPTGVSIASDSLTSFDPISGRSWVRHVDDTDRGRVTFKLFDPRWDTPIAVAAFDENQQLKVSVYDPNREGTQSPVKTLIGKNLIQSGRFTTDNQGRVHVSTEDWTSVPPYGRFAIGQQAQVFSGGTGTLLSQTGPGPNGTETVIYGYDQNLHPQGFDTLRGGQVVGTGALHDNDTGDRVSKEHRWLAYYGANDPRNIGLEDITSVNNFYNRLIHQQTHLFENNRTDEFFANPAPDAFGRNTGGFGYGVIPGKGQPVLIAGKSVPDVVDISLSHEGVAQAPVLNANGTLKSTTVPMFLNWNHFIGTSHLQAGSMLTASDTWSSPLINRDIFQRQGWMDTHGLTATGSTFQAQDILRAPLAQSPWLIVNRPRTDRALPNSTSVFTLAGDGHYRFDHEITYPSSTTLNNFLQGILPPDAQRDAPLGGDYLSRLPDNARQALVNSTIMGRHLNGQTILQPALTTTAYGTTSIAVRVKDDPLARIILDRKNGSTNLSRNFDENGSPTNTLGLFPSEEDNSPMMEVTNTAAPKPSLPALVPWGSTLGNRQAVIEQAFNGLFASHGLSQLTWGKVLEGVGINNETLVPQIEISSQLQGREEFPISMFLIPGDVDGRDVMRIVNNKVTINMWALMGQDAQLRQQFSQLMGINEGDIARTIHELPNGVLPYSVTISLDGKRGEIRAFDRRIVVNGRETFLFKFRQFGNYDRKDIERKKFEGVAVQGGDKLFSGFDTTPIQLALGTKPLGDLGVFLGPVETIFYDPNKPYEKPVVAQTYSPAEIKAVLDQTDHRDRNFQEENLVTAPDGMKIPEKAPGESRISKIFDHGYRAMQNGDLYEEDISRERDNTNHIVTVEKRDYLNATLVSPVRMDNWVELNRTLAEQLAVRKDGSYDIPYAANTVPDVKHPFEVTFPQEQEKGNIISHFKEGGFTHGLRIKEWITMALGLLSGGIFAIYALFSRGKIGKKLPNNAGYNTRTGPYTQEEKEEIGDLVEDVGLEYGFDADVINYAKRPIVDFFHNNPPDAAMKSTWQDHIEYYRQWAYKAIPQLIGTGKGKIDVDHLTERDFVLMRLVSATAGATNSITPGLRFALFTGLKLGYIDGKITREQFQEWYLKAKAQYESKLPNGSGVPKSERVTYNDINDLFAIPEYVAVFMDNMQKGKFVFPNATQKTFKDRFGDIKRKWLTHAVMGTLGATAAGLVSYFHLAENIAAFDVITMMGAFFAAFTLNNIGLMGWAQYFKVTKRYHIPLFLSTASLITLAALPHTLWMIPTALAAYPVFSSIKALFKGHQLYRKTYDSLPPETKEGYRHRHLTSLFSSLGINASKLGLKFGWNSIIYTLMTQITGNIMALNLSPVGTATIIGLIWIPFLMFAVLDMFTFLHFGQFWASLVKGYRNGIGSVTSLKGILRKKEVFVEEMPQELMSAIAHNWQNNDIVLSSESSQLSNFDFQTLGNEEARRRLEFLVGSFTSMNMPKYLMPQERPEAQKKWNEMQSLSLIVVSASELVKNHYEDIIKRQDTGLSVLNLVIRAHEDEWEKRLIRMESELRNVPGINQSVLRGFLEKSRELRGIDAPDIPAEFNNIRCALNGTEVTVADYIKEQIEDFVNMRSPSLYRTVKGLAETWDAYTAIASYLFPNETPEQIQDRVRQKLELIWGYQDYDALGPDDQRVKDIDALLTQYPAITLAFISNNEVGARYAGKDNVTMKFKGRIHAQYKPMNQNNIMSVVTKENTFFLDANNAIRFEDALKFPALMAEFNADPTLMGINVPEYITTEKLNWIAKSNGFADNSGWTSSGERVAALAQALGFYGHGAVFKTHIIREAGVLAPDFTSEDLMMAIQTWLLNHPEYHIDHREYMEVGKGREISIVSGAVPNRKFSSGHAELMNSRQMERFFANPNIQWYQKNTLFDFLSFYTKKPLILAAIPFYLFAMVYLGISGYSIFVSEIGLALFGIWCSQMIGMLGFSQLILKRGLAKAVVNYLGIVPSATVLALIANSVGLHPFALNMMIAVSVASALSFTGIGRLFDIRKGIHDRHASLFGLLPKLAVVFITHLINYGPAAVRGMKGLSEFIISAKGWMLERVSISKSVYQVVNQDDKKAVNGKYPGMQSGESFRFGMLLGMATTLIATWGMYIWQTPQLAFSLTYLLSAPLWVFAPIMTLPGMLVGATGFHGFKGYFSFANLYRKIMSETYGVIFAKDKDKKLLWFSPRVSFLNKLSLAAILVYEGLILGSGAYVALSTGDWKKALFFLPVSFAGVFTTLFAGNSVYYLLKGLWNKIEKAVRPGIAWENETSTGKALPAKGGTIKLSRDKAMLAGERLVNPEMIAQQIIGNIYPEDSLIQDWKPVNRVSTGGIDLGNTVVDVQSSGDFIQTAFNDPVMLRLLLNSDGLTPIIYDIKQMTPSMVNHFVGLN